MLKCFGLLSDVCLVYALCQNVVRKEASDSTLFLMINEVMPLTAAEDAHTQNIVSMQCATTRDKDRPTTVLSVTLQTKQQPVRDERSCLLTLHWLMEGWWHLLSLQQPGKYCKHAYR